MSGSLPGAVVIGGYANAVGVVRSLGRRGIPVAVVLTMPQDIAHGSRYASEHVRVPDLSRNPEALLELLSSRSAEWRDRVVIPTNDYALTTLASELELLSRSYRLPVPPWEIARRVIDKSLTLHAAREVGIDVPRSFGPANSEMEIPDDIPYPVVVKPRRGHSFADRFGKKLLLARDRGELRAAIDRVERAGIACEILEMIPGPDDHHYSYDTYRTAGGEFVGDFVRRKLRQSPPFFGVARAAEPAADPSLRERSYELLRRLDWRGFASVSYKRDERTGRFHLMEVNGRCTGGHGLATRAGIDVPYMIYSESVHGTPHEAIRPNGWSGVWIHLHADILYTALHWRDENLDWRAFLASYRRPKTFAVWSRSDPRPFAMQWLHTVRKAARSSERKRMLGRVQAPEPAPEDRTEPAFRSGGSVPDGGER